MGLVVEVTLDLILIYLFVCIFIFICDSSVYEIFVFGSLICNCNSVLQLDSKHRYFRN